LCRPFTSVKRGDYLVIKPAQSCCLPACRTLLVCWSCSSLLQVFRKRSGLLLVLCAACSLFVPEEVLYLPLPLPTFLLFFCTGGFSSAPCFLVLSRLTPPVRRREKSFASLPPLAADPVGLPSPLSVDRMVLTFRSYPFFDGDGIRARSIDIIMIPLLFLQTSS